MTLWVAPWVMLWVTPWVILGMMLWGDPMDDFGGRGMLWGDPMDDPMGDTGGDAVG